MMKFRENEDAVSPVIGVILMVAITVILAAVIAAFVFGMGSGVQSTKTVSVTLQKDGTDLKVIINGGPDLAELNYLKVTFDGDSAVYTGKGSSTTMTATTPTGERTFEIGQIFKTTGGKLDKPKHVIVIGGFKDGQEQMLADRHF